MHAKRSLTEDELACLPPYARALKGDEKREGKISCSPQYLKFPHDQPSLHVAKVTLWNRTKDYVEVKVQKPKSNVFQVYCENNGIYGGAQTTLWVTCKPQKRKICFDCVRISVNEGEEIISLPLQLFPGLHWFSSLPKVIVMPHVTVGNVAEVVVGLPPQPQCETFFVTVRTCTPQYTDAFSITPFSGVLGGAGDSEMQELVIRYTPSQYVTLVHVVEIHFPGIDAVPHDLLIFARAIPGLESDKIMREVAILEGLMAQSARKADKKVPEPKLRFQTSAEKKDSWDVAKTEEDLTKPAGVMHFLLRKEEDFFDSTRAYGPLGMSCVEEQRVYSEMEKKFKTWRSKEQSRQKNIPMQNGTAFLGDEPPSQALLDQLALERDEQQAHYERLMGLRDDDMEDVNRTKLFQSNQRSVRRIGDEFPTAPILGEEEIAVIEEEGRVVVRNQTLRRFIQAAYVLMARYRVSKRIPKIKALIRELKGLKLLKGSSAGSGSNRGKDKVRSR